MADEDKTEEATPKKKRDERKKGNIFQSRDITVAISIFVCFYGLYFLMPYMFEGLKGCLYYFIGLGSQFTYLTVNDSLAILRDAFLQCLLIVLPLLLISLVANLAVTLLQTQFLFAPEALKPKFSKLNPLSGIKRIISVNSLVTLVKNLLKIIVMVVIIYFVIRDVLDSLANTLDMSLAGAMMFTGSNMISLVLKVGLAFLAIAVIDYFYQRYDYNKKLRMSKHEVKQEYKQMEGDPKIKGKRRQLQQQMAMRRMMEKVPAADVIVRNPTHFAVALQYTESDRAPVVVAKGKDLIAMRIVEIAEEHRVPTYEKVELARALYATVEVGQEIPRIYYEAVAEVIAWAYSLK